ncbi:sensor histidine kinase [Actinophytocola algeriensis]|uniref:histidine kinase n=1 Tax=Actinophytocola algeriensis TaxID=1768010 RepID=A0A7W7Q5F5_9PSEU|nr:sensor histidine kinase [Actinophytocola algeriensis]MBB4907401.1 signal transduction histidine kinase [Actinophytocola algeriensis]MBE1479431.1 signal transduction histidine kinase [Actinophytocola algeriensis]
MRSRRRGQVLSLAVVLGTVGLGTAVAAAVRTQIDDAWGYSAYDPVPLNIAVAVFFSAMGVLVTWHKPGNVLGWTLLAIAAWDGVGVLLTVLTGASGSPVLMWLQAWLWAPPIWAVTTLLPMIYPDGRLPSRRWWWAVALTAAGMVVYCAGLAFEDADFAGTRTVVNPLADPPLAAPLLRTGEYLLLVATILAVAGLVWRWLRASGVYRRRVTLLLCAFGFGAVQAVVRDSIPGQLPAVLDRGLEVLAFVLVPLAIAVAVTRDRLYDLDQTVRHAIVGVASAGTLFACYLGGYAVLQTVLPASVAPGSALAAGVAGAALFPVTLLVVRRVRSLLWGRRVDVVELAVGLGNRMRDQLDSAEVPAVVCEQLVRSLRLRMARLDLETDSGLRRLAQVGSMDRSGGANPERFQLWYRGVRVGQLMVLPSDGHPYLDERMAQALASLADHVAPVVAALRLDEELLQSREQVVTAREEERSRLSRELHDNVGPTLAGTRMQIEAVRTKLPADFAAVGLMDRAMQGIDDALRTLRRVVHGLRPPELDALGLSGALRELAVFLSGPSLKVETTLPQTLAPLSKQVEVAAYRIVAEALTNVVRHAQATRAEITVTLTEDRLAVAVADDGVGVPPDSGRNGMGMRFMAQRAREIKGEFTCESDHDGTVVRAVLPAVTPGG